jgi:hypothetical protein
VLAGLAMRRAAGRDWARVRHEVAPRLVLQPDERVRGAAAQSYVYPNGAGDPRVYGDRSRYLPSTSVATAAWTAGAWAGTAPSLALWANRLLSDHILRPASLRQMTAFSAGADMWGERFMTPDEARAVLDSVNAFHPLGRHGQPQDVVEAILFYASERARWITGTTMPIDGGVLAARNAPPAPVAEPTAA